MTTDHTDKAPYNAGALSALHACRSQDELDRRFAAELADLLPGVDMMLCLAADRDGGRIVQLVVGTGWQCQPGGEVGGIAPAVWLPIAYREHEVGALAVGRELDEDERRSVLAALAHYGAALANLTFNEEAQRDANEYCVTLQALEQGIVLFQEGDAEAMKARLLHQAMRIVDASAGVLYVLREVGDTSSGLILEQVLGIPDALLQGFRGQGDAAWPDLLLGQPTQIMEREADGSLGMLEASCVPEVLRRIAVVPLRYHGVEAGLCVLFNPQGEGAVTRGVAARLQSFGLLGAALLHRFRLEAESALNHSRDRELQIARTIQQRLLPSKPPATPGFTYAWSLLTAQNIGGDYLDVFAAQAGVVCGIVADASGHGINSALLMSSFRSTYRAKAPDMATDVLAAALNAEVTNEVGPTGMFITAVMYELDVTTRRLRVTSAGHTPTMLYRAATGEVEMLESDGPPLGFLAGVDYTHSERQLESGDVLLLYTDGITEAANSELDMYGEERLAELLCKHARDTAEQLLAAARKDLAGFTGRERYDDDVSLTVIRVA